MSETALTEVTTDKLEALLSEAGIDTVEALAEADVEQLVAIKGIGEATAKKLIAGAAEALESAKREAGKPEGPEEPDAAAADFTDLIGEIVHYLPPAGWEKPWPAIIQDVVDGETGTVALVAFCPPTRSMGSGGAVPVQFVGRVEYAGEEGLRPGRWSPIERVD